MWCINTINAVLLSLRQINPEEEDTRQKKDEEMGQPQPPPLQPKHSPVPTKDMIRSDSLTERCSRCYRPNNKQMREFLDLKLLIEDIAKTSNKTEEIKKLEVFKQRLDEDKSFKKLVTMCDSRKEGGCCTLLHIASDFSHFETMKILLDAGADPNAQNRWKQLPLHTVVDGGNGCHCKDCSGKNAECVKLLLQYGSEIEVEDWQGDTPLACSAICRMGSCAKILWKHGASIHKKECGSIPGEMLARCIPDEVSSWFDDAIVPDDNDNLYLNLDLGVLFRDLADLDSNQKRKHCGDVNEDIKTTQIDETRFLVYISKAPRRAREKLLLHPLVQAYLHVKWSALSYLYIYLTTAHMLMNLLYTCFIISFFLHHCSYEDGVSIDQGMENNTVLDVKVNPGLCQPTRWILFLSGFLVICLLAMICNEIVRMTLGVSQYFRSILNYGWVCMIGTMAHNILCIYVDSHRHVQYVVAAGGIFLVWGMFLTQLARHPKIGVYVEMFGYVVKEFLVFGGTYVTLLFGFALGFAVLFPKNRMFKYENGFLMIVKSLMMMTGELDYETLFDPEENSRVDKLEYSITAHIFYVGFIVVVTLLLANLLVGLTISNVQELKNKAQFSRAERLVHQIDLMETPLRNSWFPKHWKDWYFSKYSIESILTRPTVGTKRSDINKNKGVGVDTKYLRSKGPFIKRFDPIRSDVYDFPEDLKEQFTRFVDMDKCNQQRNKVRRRFMKGGTRHTN